MENPGSSIISALGAGSGIDFGRLASELSEASFSFQRETLQSRNSALEARISAASVLRSSLSNLSGALGDRIRNGDLSPQARIGNSAIARVSTTPGSSPSGSYSLEVTQLAEAQTLVSPSFASRDDLVGEGELTIRFGTVSGATFTADTDQTALSISVSATDTLADLAARISSESDGALEAYVADGTGGAQLVIKGRDGGANGFVLEPTSTNPGPTNTPGDLTYLGWSPASDSGQLRETAQNAMFELDTVALSSASNRVTGLPEGITLDLTATNIGEPTDLSFSQDTSAITQVMTDFTAALNDIVALLNGGEDGTGNALSNDQGARELRRDLARLTSEIVISNADEGAPDTLGDLGLSLNRDGTFRLDTELLARTLTESPEGAAAMFTIGPRGVFATIDRLARNNSAIGDPGSLGGSVTRYEAQIERNEERLERIAQQQSNLLERLTRSLSSAESQIATSQSTLSFIRQQFEISDNS
ncbi:MAG: flagellar filament capping protein FliD [Erythrobacter sp.]